MSIFGQIAGAQVQRRGSKIKEDGEFIVRIDKCSTQTSNRDRGLLWVVEFIVLAGSEAHPPGSRRSWVQRPEKRAQTDLGNIKAFVAAVRGENPDTMQLPEAEYERIVSAAQPFAGKVLRLLTEMTKTAENRDFCIHTWEPHDGPVPTLTAQQEALAATAPPPPPAAPAVQAAPSLTKEAWSSGQGAGTVHPTNPAYEWCPEHPDWGVRPKAV